MEHTGQRIVRDVNVRRQPHAQCGHCPEPQQRTRNSGIRGWYPLRSPRRSPQTVPAKHRSAEETALLRPPLPAGDHAAPVGEVVLHPHAPRRVSDAFCLESLTQRRTAFVHMAETDAPFKIAAIILFLTYSAICSSRMQNSGLPATQTSSSLSVCVQRSSAPTVCHQLCADITSACGLQAALHRAAAQPASRRPTPAAYSSTRAMSAHFSMTSRRHRRHPAFSSTAACAACHVSLGRP